MRRLLIVALSLLALSCAETERDDALRDNDTRLAGGGSAAGTGRHGMFTPDKVPWKAGPPSLPAGARFAVLEGDPAKEGYFCMRIMLPDGYQIPPHSHPNVERLTIISGTFHLGTGERFDKGAAPALPAGSYSFMHPGMKHFAWAEGETVVQLTTIGPWAINYVNPSDDPRRRGN
jgi:quercetin dioxygenase-like cupin family protein